jgi:hypothetical protein
MTPLPACSAVVPVAGKWRFARARENADTLPHAREPEGRHYSHYRTTTALTEAAS